MAKLWTPHFVRICVANLLLFVSLYLLFPVLPLEMAERTGTSVAQTGWSFLLLTAGMFLAGPFQAYLVDAYKRKSVCMLAMILMLAATAGYGFVQDFRQLLCLCLAQGVAFGIAATAGITLAIDITNSALRSAGNVGFAWVARLGMAIGVGLGTWLFQRYSFHVLQMVSIATGAVGVLAVSGVYVPFRAPIVTRLCSLDRFWLPRGWIPALNALLVTFVPGLLIQLVCSFSYDLTWAGISLPFFVGVGTGYVAALLCVRLLGLVSPAISWKEKPMRVVAVGIVLEVLAVSLLKRELSFTPVSLLLGVGLGLIMPCLLVMFVRLSHHCQRGTANTTHLLASELGIALGIAVACRADLTPDRILHIGQAVAFVAFLFFIFVTCPYYSRKRVRG